MRIKWIIHIALRQCLEYSKQGFAYYYYSFNNHLGKGSDIPDTGSGPGQRLWMLIVLPPPLAPCLPHQGSLIDSYSMGLSKLNPWIKPISPDMVSSLVLEMRRLWLYSPVLNLLRKKVSSIKSFEKLRSAPWDRMAQWAKMGQVWSPHTYPSCVWMRWTHLDEYNIPLGQFISCKRRVALVGYAHNREVCMWGSGGNLGTFCSFLLWTPNFSKNKIYFFLMPLREWKNRFIGGRDMWTFDSTILTGNWETSWVEMRRKVAPDFTRIALLGWVTVMVDLSHLQSISICV